MDHATVVREYCLLCAGIGPDEQSLPLCVPRIDGSSGVAHVGLQAEIAIGIAAPQETIWKVGCLSG
jgi:hypothetical protein